MFVRPTHPALCRAGLKYVAFPRALAAEEAAGLWLIEAMPASGIYIYELNEIALYATILPVSHCSQEG